MARVYTWTHDGSLSAVSGSVCLCPLPSSVYLWHLYRGLRDPPSLIRISHKEVAHRTYKVYALETLPSISFVFHSDDSLTRSLVSCSLREAYDILHIVHRILLVGVLTSLSSVYSADLTVFIAFVEIDIIVTMPGYRIASKRDGCAGCRDKPSDGIPFRVCKGCRLVSFCSKACQRESWSSHRHVFQLPPIGLGLVRMIHLLRFICRTICREAQGANGLNTDTIAGRESAHIHRLARDFWEAYEGPIHTYVSSKVMDHFRNNRSVSFITFDWSNHFFLLSISPRFENVEDTTNRSPATFFRIQSGTFGSFNDLDATTRSSLDLGPEKVTKIKGLNTSSSRVGAVGMLPFLIDFGESRHIIATFPISPQLSVGAAFDINPAGPSELLILQTIVDRGIDLRFDRERGREAFHRMVHVRPGWKWEPLQQTEEEDLKSDEGMRRILDWFDEN